MLLHACPSCAELAREFKWEETCVGSFGKCEVCGTDQKPNPCGGPHTGIFAGLAVFKAPDDAVKLIRTAQRKRLYAIAYEYRVRNRVRDDSRKVGEAFSVDGVWKPDIIYCHAMTDGDARVQFLNSEAPEHLRFMRIVGVAPVLGFHVENSQGTKVAT